MEYIGGRMIVKYVVWKDLPLGTRVDVSLAKNTPYSKMDRGYYWTTFEFVGKDMWQIKRVWFVHQTKDYVNVENGQIYTFDDFFDIATKGGESSDIYLSVPLQLDNDMRMLITDGHFVYPTKYNAASLLKEVADNKSNTYIKFRHDENDKLTINIIKNNKTYFLVCQQSDYDRLCKHHSIDILQHSFNTYF